MWKRFEEFLRDISLTIRREKELDLNRRGFVLSGIGLIFIYLLSTLPFVGQVFQKAKAAPEPFKITELNELQVGESKLFTYPRENDPAILVRVKEDMYRSYHIKCTHLECPVYWDQPTEKLVCPCHQGFFSVEDGSALAGPPTRPLPSIELDFKSDGIYAIGVHRHTV
ncbi:ubiquinol-cytochrome c reductase iron-sulfur subunit [Caldalkalibacillus mannanilyticus]|uniref:QcrA and Rieske domain-containing protein n=1 Tax=Caldalkalibacillus mannanilyticus TaxID=1418 RepID=UPI000469D1D8|nr:ubiquinol-cytochrome c reductase iron-sulfur subunit [Caldalkalibacillus mannanilyticus]